MAVGKNKRISKGRKGGKKKTGDAFLKKEWYDLKAPQCFQVRTFGKTLVNKTQGTKLSSDSLKGRVFEVNMADLTTDEEHGYRKINLICEDIQGRSVLTNFHGVSMTRHHLCSLIKKWHSIVEAYVDCRTTDGYVIRMFCIGFSQRKKNQVKSTCYIRSSKQKLIRKKMVQIMTQHATTKTLRKLIQELGVKVIERAIESATRNIFPIENVHVRKIKVLKKPKFDATKLMELHGDIGTEVLNAVVEESPDAKNLLSSEIAT